MSKQKKQSKLVPELRFPEFVGNGEWEKKKLSDFLEFKNGINASREQYGKGIKFINVLDIIQNPFITYDKIIGSVDIPEKEISKNEVSYGDILFQRSSETREDAGQANVYLDKVKKAVFGGFVIRGKKKSEYEPIFMNYLLRTESARKEITSRSAGSTRFNIGQDALNEVEILFPKSKKEQQKIAQTLTSLDDLIAAENEKLDALQAHKKGLLQQLFPAKGERVPKVRFGEFGGAWEEMKLEDVCEINPSSDSLPKEFVYIDLESVESGKLLKKIKINLEVAPSRAQRLLIKGDTIFQMVRPYQRNNYFFNPTDSLHYVASTGYAQLRAFQSKRYLFQYIHNDDFVNRVLAKCTGSNYPAINSRSLAKVKVLIPKKTKEQQKIANCLSSLDDQIAAQSEKIEALKEHKKGLMQGLFPSIV